MGEPSQDEEKRGPGRPPKRVPRKVLSLAVREGGNVELAQGVRSHLPGPIVGMEMVWDPDIDSVRVSFNARGPDGKVFRDYMHIPRHNIRQWKLEE